ncbi:glycosyl transferase [Leptothermofonsia sichuanensis E412]|uniref:glycosyltransferase family protein n=1 Tax=Leptothermofonsia sichuanensis TaxID=2917832 RepID=UPI001CA75283|nr:glycosyltransferase [Leptothermofonsia sichuanensis]QZZ19692.1 glycosyl transferase [Leptothermofonsia sichuanensis E412]
MKRLVFYCQHILGMGHLVRSMEIVRGLVNDFQVCFINGGEVIEGFAVPLEVEVINLPAIKTDSEFQTLQPVDASLTLAEVQEIRKMQLLQVCKRIQPDVLMIELFPFGRGKFSFELIPLIEQVRSLKACAKIVCSLRDIVVTKRDQAKYEQKVCKLMNQYFDLLLVHGDPQFQPLEETFSRVRDLRCPVHYTGYVVQPQPETDTPPICDRPLILVSVGGGRFGHELLECVVQTAPILANQLPHLVQVFTGPFMPEAKFAELQAMAQGNSNLRIDRFTPNLLAYMQQADLSISMSGYNTTMNVLTTGVRAMILPFTGNDDQEQTIRAAKLEQLGVVDRISPEDLNPDRFAQKIITCLQKQPASIRFDFNGVANTARLINDLIAAKQVA